MTRITDLRGDLQSESCGSLFKSPLAGGGAYWGLPHCYSLLLLLSLLLSSSSSLWSSYSSLLLRRHTEFYHKLRLLR